MFTVGIHSPMVRLISALIVDRLPYPLGATMPQIMRVGRETFILIWKGSFELKIFPIRYLYPLIPSRRFLYFRLIFYNSIRPSKGIYSRARYLFVSLYNVIINT